MGRVFGIVLLPRGASSGSFKQVEKETKDELRWKEHKGRMQSSPDSWPPTGAVMKLSLRGAFETWTIAPVLLFRKKNHVSQNVILAKFTGEAWPEVRWHIRIISVDILTDPNMYRHRGLQNEGNTSRHERSFPARQYTSIIEQTGPSCGQCLLKISVHVDLCGTFKVGVSNSF